MPGILSASQVTASDVLDTARMLFDKGADVETISVIRQALPSLEGAEKRFSAYLLMACAEWRKGWAKQSLQTLGKASALFDAVTPRLKGRFHGQRAVVHSRLKNPDAALMDLVAAKFWAEEAGDDEEIAIARNNLSKQYSDAGRFEEAITEIDAAISYAQRHGGGLLLGQFYDMKAQVFVNAGKFVDALSLCRKAIELLNDHPSETEARETYGRALIGLGAEYLTHAEDPVSTFRAKRHAADLVSEPLTKDLIALALEQSNGNILNAAERLGVYHSALLKAIKKCGIRHKPRARSLVTK